MRMIVWCLAAWFTAGSLCGCETVKGVGRDIEGVGASVQHAISSRNG